jgi:AcrR family transcriptional regulator
MAAPSLRARIRAELTNEIKETARRHVAAHGAANLSLRAVARDVGMVSSAVYRYFASRDELLTALIIDAYDALGEAVEVADAGVERGDLMGRFRAVCAAVRDWALAHPHEYALIYGSPVPGYAAPQDTVGPATRVTRTLGAILADGAAAGILRAQPGDWLAPAVDAEMERVAAQVGPGIPKTVMARGLMIWAHLFGAVSFEVFGRLVTIIENHQAWYDHQVDAMAKLVGLRP